jgi:hypothetical protein
MKDLLLTKADVEQLQRQCRHCNVFSIYLPRYYPPRKNHPVGKILEKLINECMGYLEAMSLEELSSLVDNMPPGLKMLLDFDPTQPMDDHIRQRVAMSYLMGVTQQSYISFQDALFPNVDVSAVLRIYPELRDAIDDGGSLSSTPASNRWIWASSTRTTCFIIINAFVVAWHRIPTSISCTAVLSHFDGAVKMYGENEYATRLESYMLRELRGDAKPKLFRVDGDIDVDHWIELMAHFFKGNEMMIEYFDPDEFERRFGAQITKWAEMEASHRPHGD